MNGSSKVKFVDLHGQGKKLCRLVAGGMFLQYIQCVPTADIFKATLHIIPLVALAGLKSMVREMALAEINEVAQLFRTPER